jgi:hypothetical protein
MAGLARVLSAAQQLRIHTIDKIWCKLAKLCEIACNRSCIISDIATVHSRVQHGCRYAKVTESSLKLTHRSV